MKTTVKRVSFCLTKESEKQLNELIARLGENRSQVISRCITAFHGIEKRIDYFKMRKSERNHSEDGA